MRRFSKLSMLCLVAGTVGACNNLETSSTNPGLPTAGIRFINAMPDSMGTGGLDFRFTDFVENNAQFQIKFRNAPAFAAGVPASAIQFKPVQVTGTPRAYSIFLDDTIPSIASTVVNSGTLTLTADHNYSLIIWGYARSAGTDKMKVTLIDETAEQAKAPLPADGNPGVGKVAVRMMNATNKTIDGFQYVCTSGTNSTSNCAGVLGAVTWAAIAPYSVSPYVIRDTSFMAFHVNGAEAGAFPDVVGLTGSVALCAQLACTVGAIPDIEATAGTKIEGSAVTAIVWPGSTPTQNAAIVNTAQSAQVVTGGVLTTLGYVYTTGATALTANATGYARAAGSFITDGFVVGQTVTANGFQNVANNGTSTVTAVTALALTVTKTGGTVVDNGPTVITTGATAISATATGYNRTAGSFIADGFLIGMGVSASGFAAADTIFLPGLVVVSNNGSSIVTAVTATDLTVAKAPQHTVPEGATCPAGSTGCTATKTISTSLNRSIAAPRSNITFMWDRRPKRCATCP